MFPFIAKQTTWEQPSHAQSILGCQIQDLCGLDLLGLLISGCTRVSLVFPRALSPALSFPEVSEWDQKSQASDHLIFLVSGPIAQGVWGQGCPISINPGVVKRDS